MTHRIFQNMSKSRMLNRSPLNRTFSCQLSEHANIPMLNLNDNLVQANGAEKKENEF